MSLISEIRTGIAGLDQSTQALKKFAKVMIIAFALLAVAVFLFGEIKIRAAWLLSISIIFLLLALLLPKWLKPIHTLWMMLAFFLGYFMSRILLTLLFYLVITPIGLLMRLFGKDVLGIKLNKNADSYWLKRNRKEQTKADYERLF